MHPDGHDRAEVTTALNATPVQADGPGSVPRLIDHLRLDGVEFRPIGELRLTTERSVWLLGTGTYYRMPKDEQPREQDGSIEGRMDDGLRHPYRRSWFSLYNGIWLRVRILPEAGPVDGVGIFTGGIIAICGKWEEVEPDRSEP